jgi:hypothetical protein
MKLITFFTIVIISLPMWAQQAPSRQPTDAHKILADDAGTWDAEVRMYFQGPEGPATTSKGVETNELVSGGKFARTTFKYKMRNKEFEGHGLMGYDPRSKEYVGTWVDNFTTIPSQMKGSYDPTKKTLTILSTVVDGAGTEMMTKKVITFVDSGIKTLEISMVVDAGGKKQEIKLMDMTAKKRS